MARTTVRCLLPAHFPRRSSSSSSSYWTPVLPPPCVPRGSSRVRRHGGSSPLRCLLVGAFSKNYEVEPRGGPLFLDDCSASSLGGGREMEGRTIVDGPLCPPGARATRQRSPLPCVRNAGRDLLARMQSISSSGGASSFASVRHELMDVWPFPRDRRSSCAGARRAEYRSPARATG